MTEKSKCRLALGISVQDLDRLFGWLHDAKRVPDTTPTPESTVAIGAAALAAGGAELAQRRA